MEIKVQKNLQLTEGEDLMDLINKIREAMAVNRAKMKMSLGLLNIFSDYVIAKDFESNRFFKLELSRDDAGGVVLGDAQEVRQVYVPMDQDKTEKSLELDTIKVEPVSIWRGIIR